MKNTVVVIFILSIQFAFGQDIPMRKEYIGENTRKVNPVYYFPDHAITSMKVNFKEGLLFDQDQRLLESYSSAPSLYILSLNGDLIFSAYSKHGMIHHSSLSQGESVLAAGQMVVRSGRLMAIDLVSGHYRPDDQVKMVMKQFLIKNGVDMDRVKWGEAEVMSELKLLKNMCHSLMN